MSSTVIEFTQRLLGGAIMEDREIDQWISLSDISNAGQFYAGDIHSVYQCVQQASTVIVNNYLNNSNKELVPLRRRTLLCLILNNFALHEPVRAAVFNCMEGLSQTFEEAIREEGLMAFDQELGRMSEHVLVLLMRVMGYTLKAPAVHEFADGNIQFAVQLLLAVLLKEPPYELDLRFNCISGLLGFTQPQTFFDPTKELEEHSCENFTGKINFIMELMLRLQTIQIVSDVLTEAIAEAQELKVSNAVINVMRLIMNIFKFSSEEGSTSPLQWRQHVLLSTTFMDGTVIMFVQGLMSVLDATVRSQVPVALPRNVIPSLTLSLKFGSFCTYHLGEAAKELRLYCTFFHDLLTLPLRGALAPSTATMELYVNLLHFFCNVDALAGEEGVSTHDLLPELTSSGLRETLDRFFRSQLAMLDVSTAELWYKHFIRSGTDIMVAYDSSTYQSIDALFLSVLNEMKNGGQKPAPAPAPAPAVAAPSLSDLPSLKPKKDTKVSIAKAANPVKEKRKKVPIKSHAIDVNAQFLCALTGTVMKNPVSSPYGQTFEKESILRWLEENGSICPITGKTLTAEDLKTNQEVASKLIQRAVLDSIAQQDDDLYNF